MANVEVRFVAGYADGSMEWEETASLNDAVDFKQQLEQLVVAFNEEERRRKELRPEYPMQRERKLVRIIGLTGTQYCELQKLDIYPDNHSYVKWRCKKCGFTKKYNMSPQTNLVCHPELTCPNCGLRFKNEDKKRKHDCQPDCVCSACNKQFATPFGLQVHENKQHG